MALSFFQLTCALLVVTMLVEVNSQGTIRNPFFFNTNEKSIRGFYFKNYYDFISGAYIPTALDQDGKKTIKLKGNQISWTLELKVNKNLFSPTYKHYDAQHKPQESNLRNCYYHGRVGEERNSFLALSDCDGLHGMVVISDALRFSIHTLEQNRGIIIVRENSILNKFGFYEKTTSNLTNAERVFNVREKRNAEPVPNVKNEPTVKVEEKEEKKN
ncbi:Disintegrin and metalloproteinase domain-containing protein 19, partial [Coelomomyces lativittatus]